MKIFDIGDGAVVIRPDPTTDRIGSLSKEQLKEQLSQTSVSDQAAETYLRYITDQSLGR
jgi:hypothetical protein